MSLTTLIRFICISFALAAGSALAVTAGSPAPDFAITDTTGKAVRLSDYKGKFVVLEWTNPDCPFVQAQYGADAMQALQKEWGAKDIVWLTINSTNQSNGEYKSAGQMNAWIKDRGAAPKAVLLDGSSATGRAYSAKTTPHMFVIDPSGTIVYNGAIDDKRSARQSDRKIANNYVRAALTEAVAGKPVSVASTTPYGCSIKY
jgi:dipeptidyl aminopeptidase/acylaminoacyl peptidase